KLLAVAFDEAVGYLPDGESYTVRRLPQLLDDLKHLCLDIHSPVGDKLPMVLAGHLAQSLPCAGVFDHAEQRNENLCQARLNRAVYQCWVNLAFHKVPKAEHEQFVAELYSLAFIAGSQVDGDVVS